MTAREIEQLMTDGGLAKPQQKRHVAARRSPRRERWFSV
jgi:hypothetical protein